MATLCCCPPESSVTFDLAFVSKPTIFRYFSAIAFSQRGFFPFINTGQLNILTNI